MKKIIGHMFLALALSTSLILSACGKSNDTIKVVVAGPMTGSSAQFGESMKEGTQMAANEINKKGGLLGKKIELDFEDDKGDPKEAVNIAQRISTDSNVVGIIGHFTSSATMAASPIYQKAGIPEIAVASTTPKATSAGNYIFRVNVTNTAQGAGIIKWLVQEKHKKRLAIFYDNDDYGNGITNDAIKTADRIGAQIVYKGSITPGVQQDFHVMLDAAKQAKPDALVLFTLYSTGAQIVSEADKMGLHLLTVGSDAIYAPDFIRLAGKSAEGVYVATWFHPDSNYSGTRKFVTDFKKTYNKDTDSWAPYSYDALMIFADAVKKAGKIDRSAIRDTLAKTKNFKGATGVITFNKQRVPDPSSMKLLFTVVKNGKFQLVK
ncbi:ABC transporter substrate-binding protein [Fodinisporobacter ferrooxydans]|uniref:ABC transporter substrate-binding protein n=1 Tax=Fodinisporobacter ferrooxydans TaxID=2901836 RepID=A0ABY4CEB9_9BACL|nr:ABC transporter substrate-binding protein [Alicyclobacillaceae bacterium MYW30-H2]